MFTGLIAEVGRVASLTRRGREASVTVGCARVLEGAKEGDSICVDGACLTVETLAGDGFTAFVSEETLARTTLAGARAGSAVNLEASLRPGDRMGGHMVQGHVEGVGEVLSVRPVGDGAVVAVGIPEDLLEAVVPKGSIALAGISLTVAALSGNQVEVAAIPATLRGTTMGSWRAGWKVNVETDMVGRYIVAYLKRLRPGRGITIDELIDKGF